MTLYVCVCVCMSYVYVDTSTLMFYFSMYKEHDTSDQSHRLFMCNELRLATSYALWSFKSFRIYVDVHVAKNLNHFEQILYLTFLKILIGLEYLKFG